MATPVTTTALPDPRPEADGVLLDRVSRGDTSAFAALYDRHGLRVHSLAHLLCGGNAAVTDVVTDVVRGVFLDVWRRPCDFDPAGGTVAVWLLALARRRAIDALRTGSAPPSGTAPDHAILGPMRTALAGLPEPERRSLTLLYYGGYTQSEVAAILGVPLATVGALTTSAVCRLRRRSAPELHDDR